jgi:hypothetical protein
MTAAEITATGAPLGDPQQTVMQGGGRPQLTALWLMALPLIVLLGTGMGYAFGVRGGDIQVLALALLTGAVAFVPVILDIGRPAQRRHVLLSVVSFSWFVFFVLSVFTTYFFADFVVRREEYSGMDLAGLRPADIVRGQLGALVGLLGMQLGYSVPISKLIPGGVPRPRYEWPYRSTLIVALFMIPLGWVLYGAGQLGLMPKRLGSGFLGSFANVAYYGIALLMLVYLRFRTRGPLRMMMLLIPPTMFFNFFTGSKGLFLAPIAMVAIAYIVVMRRVRLRWIALAVVAFSLLYPVAEFYRRVVLKNYSLGASYALQRPIEVLSKISTFATSIPPSEYLLSGISATSMRFDGLGITTVIMRDCPNPIPYQGGWTIGYIALSYVPRIVWADKPEMTSGQWVTDNFGGGPVIRSSTGSSWVGEFYFNFGFPGIALGMLVMGVYFRVLHEMLLHPNAVFASQLMAVIVLYAIPPQLGGSLMAPVNGTIMGSLPVVMAHWGVRLFGGRPRKFVIDDEPEPELAAEANPR